MRYRRQTKIFQEINVIPLIDIALVLLIIFMITATLIVAGTGLDIKLPKAKTANIQKQIQLVIFITRDNQIFLGGEKVDIKTLMDRLKEDLKKFEKVVVTISADKKIRYEKLIEVLDAVRLVGVENIALAAELEKIPLNK